MAEVLTYNQIKARYGGECVLVEDPVSDDHHLVMSACRDRRRWGSRRIIYESSCLLLPNGATIDGLLGLDFLHNRVLTLGFREGRIHLT
jgi:hypothetical protein